MAYRYDGIATTQSGKVIYRRKPHAWTPKDLVRIIKKIDYPGDSVKELDYLAGVLVMLAELRHAGQSEVRALASELLGAVDVYMRRGRRFTGFGGGMLGGGGAGGIFGLPLDPTLKT